MDRLATIGPSCSPRTGPVLAKGLAEVGICLSASSSGGQGWDRLDSAGPRTQQVHFEYIVKPVLAHPLEAFAQRGRSDNPKFSALRQEDNPSLPRLVEMDGCEGLS